MNPSVPVTANSWKNSRIDNPFLLLKLIWHSRKPSLVDDMPVLCNGFWLRKGYDALTFFGTIITATDDDALLMNSRRNGQLNELKNHEMIHLRQAQDTHNSWWCFYLRYVWYWLRALPLSRQMRGAAYRLNPFEMEAYAHMHDAHYLEQCGGVATEWRRWAKLSPTQRLQWYREKGLTIAPSGENTLVSPHT